MPRTSTRAPAASRSSTSSTRSKQAARFSGPSRSLPRSISSSTHARSTPSAWRRDAPNTSGCATSPSSEPPAPTSTCTSPGSLVEQPLERRRVPARGSRPARPPSARGAGGRSQLSVSSRRPSSSPRHGREPVLACDDEPGIGERGPLADARASRGTCARTRRSAGLLPAATRGAAPRRPPRSARGRPGRCAPPSARLCALDLAAERGPRAWPCSRAIARWASASFGSGASCNRAQRGGVAGARGAQQLFGGLAVVLQALDGRERCDGVQA